MTDAPAFTQEQRARLEMAAKGGGYYGPMSSEDLRSLLAAYDAQAADLKAAWHELHCCDDINLDRSLAEGIGELQADRERLTADPTAARQAAVGEGERKARADAAYGEAMQAWDHARKWLEKNPTSRASLPRDMLEAGLSSLYELALAPASPVAVEEQDWVDRSPVTDAERARTRELAKSGIFDAPPTEPGGVEDDFPAALNFATKDLLRRFIQAVARKLRTAETKHGYTDGWARDGWQDECVAHFAEHVRKGDPLDVAAYAAFCWHHGWSTSPSPVASGAEAEDVAGLVEEEWDQASADEASPSVTKAMWRFWYLEAERLKKRETYLEGQAVLAHAENDRLAAALSHQARASVDGDWVLVPRQVWPELCAAIEGEPYNSDHFLDHELSQRVWTQVLAAAPRASVEEGGAAGHGSVG